MQRLLRHLLVAPTTPSIDSIDALRARTRDLAANFPLPFDRAAATALASDRLGFAFAAGYQGALHAMLPSLPLDATASLCATEEGGAHPRAIATRLDASPAGGFTLHGKKRWSTFAPAADSLFVVASIGAGDDGRNRLKLVRVDRNAEGVHVEPMPATPFAPEIPHAEVTFDGARVSHADVLEGDGYDRYVKPFRTIEDAHVFGALASYVCGVARTHGWPRTIVEELVAWIAALRSIALAEPSSGEIHVALAGAFTTLRALLARVDAHWTSAPAEIRARWERDRALLEIAGKARALRLEAAWKSLAR